MHLSRTSFIGSWLCLAGVVAGLAAFKPHTPAASLEGAWMARGYAIAGGPRHEVRGRIFFTADEWQVLFFVMDGDEPRRGSGEGGRYTFDGETLTFEHLHHLSAGEAMDGLPASPLTLTARAGDGPLEPTGVELDGDALTLLFPTGNSMSFIRSPAP